MSFYFCCLIPTVLHRFKIIAGELISVLNPKKQLQDRLKFAIKTNGFPPAQTMKDKLEQVQTALG